MARSGEIVIRRAGPTDAEAIGLLVVRAWREGYKDLMPADFLATMSANERAATMLRLMAQDDRTLCVASDETGLVGMVIFGPSREEEGSGEVVALNVDPRAWRRGVGSSLLRHSSDALRRDHPEALLWALVGNERARSFYEAHGWSRDGTRKTEEWWGVPLNDECYRRRLIEG